MPEKYETVQTSDGRAWVRSSALADLREVDSVVFDCDGVLVDARRSYDATITEVVDQLLRMLVGIRLPWKDLAPQLILQLRRTGGFNNDWDSAYALILFSILALPENDISSLSQSQHGSGGRGINISSERTRTVTATLKAVVDDFCSASTDGDRASDAVNRFLQAQVQDPTYASVISNVQEQLGYPGSPPRSLLSTIFDEIYHGPRLFRQMYGVDARYYRGRGLIERERVLISPRDLDAASKLLGGRRFAIATGRPYFAAKYVLRDMMNYFSRKASIFLGDADVHPELATQLAPFRKPSGRSLIHARRTLSSDTLLYVGDSAEDVKMVEDAKRTEESVLSAGTYGTSIDQSDQLRFFKDRGVDLILPTARQIPSILRLVKNEKRKDREKN